MPEPVSSSGLAVAAGAALAVPVITAFGVPLGLHPSILIAGLFGSFVAMVLLHTVPSAGQGWAALLRTSVRRVAVALASSLTAGYMVPIVLDRVGLSEPMMLGTAFVVGAGAQWILQAAIRRLSRTAAGAAGPPDAAQDTQPGGAP